MTVCRWILVHIQVRSGPGKNSLLHLIVIVDNKRHLAAPFSTFPLTHLSCPRTHVPPALSGCKPSHRKQSISPYSHKSTITGPTPLQIPSAQQTHWLEHTHQVKKKNTSPLAYISLLPGPPLTPASKYVQRRCIAEMFFLCSSCPHILPELPREPPAGSAIWTINPSQRQTEADRKKADNRQLKPALISCKLYYASWIISPKRINRACSRK